MPIFVLKYIMPIMKNAGKYILIGIAVWFLFNKAENWVSNYKQEQINIGAYEHSNETNKATLAKKEAEIKVLTDQLEEQKQANARNAAKITEVQNENEDFRERISRHDIDAIIARRGSAVVERAYTSGTNRYFKLWNDETSSLRQYGIDRANGLSGSAIPDATTTDEKPE